MAGTSSKALAFLLAKPKLAASVAVAATAVAGTGVATYNSGPGDALWGLQKTVFSSHAQQVAVNDVASDLKNAQALLSKNPIGADDLGQARNYLNQAKQLIDDASNVPDANQRAGLQQLYLQLTQNLADSVPPPADLPAAPDASLDANAQGSVATQASAQLPTWGYSTQAAASASAPQPPAQVAGADISNPPGEADPDWSDPTPAAATLNQQELGYYDPTWDTFYGYNRDDWHRWGLDGYNPYGYDYTGYDRYGYDRAGYDRWGYDRRGYDRYGYNYAGWRYDPISRMGWHRDGYNEWGQRQGHPDDPRNAGWRDKWYNRYQGYYENRWYYNDPVYQRHQWDRDRWLRQNPSGADAQFNVYVETARLRPFLPVVNLNVSLGQFVDIQVPRQTRDFVRNGVIATLAAADIVAHIAQEAVPIVRVRQQQEQFFDRRAAEANAKVALDIPVAGSLNAQFNAQASGGLATRPDPGQPNPRPGQNGQASLSSSVEAAAAITTPPIFGAGANVQQLLQVQQSQQQQRQQRVSAEAKAQIQAEIAQEQKSRPTTPPKQPVAPAQGGQVGGQVNGQVGGQAGAGGVNGQIGGQADGKAGGAGGVNGQIGGQAGGQVGPGGAGANGQADGRAGASPAPEPRQERPQPQQGGQVGGQAGGQAGGQVGPGGAGANGQIGGQAGGKAGGPGGPAGGAGASGQAGGQAGPGGPGGATIPAGPGGR
ncbi:hypothetical protein Srot_0125 [Segniliparus rotundus DSM 44985]|uniref:Uncharacterized protein n=1 Tax=Segniliparus rotundus (strain ATCC BAA-972 / CDC 1076 / CIP 108378 / DSM 44985 / JCM 13578) TaxID=640132 RepID=D6ZA73_SEGRD|nr:hypothetical protein [Segniliparus rotundus]ADG96615.1 hypothetical protein Srot_0125 [Segniliparus rotundus DSM 44985]